MRWRCFLCCITALFVVLHRIDAGTLAQFRTPLGEIDVELFDQDKPATVQNFIRYVQTGAYADMFMHRWVPGFVIQGGGFAVSNRLATNAIIVPVTTFSAITNEYAVGRTFSNKYGTIAMARVGGQTNSATSQWFFNLTDNASLDGVDGGFTAFGRVVSGTNVLDRFNNTATNGIYQFPGQPPLNELPVLSAKPTLADLVYTDITLLNVRVQPSARGGREISWNSVSNKINVVEFTEKLPPTWQIFFSTNAHGDILRVHDLNTQSAARFYRVRVEY